MNVSFSADSTRLPFIRLDHLASISSDGTVWFCQRFIVKFTCLFDYQSYPYDVQECPLVIGPYAPYFVELVHSDHKPVYTRFVSFIDTKTIVSNWEVLKVYQEIKYWTLKGYVDKRPSAYTWTENFIWIRLKRSAAYFGATILLPSIMTSFFTVASILIESSTNGIITLMANLMVQAIFMDDLIQKLPPNNGAVPKIGMQIKLRCYN